jgi:ERCC4-type nuclease
MQIKVDYRETDLLAKLNALLSSSKRENITIVQENLPLGDIIICDDTGNEKVIIERKTIADLAASIRDGRYKEQSFRLNECSMANHNIFYLIEGNLQTYRPFGKQNAVDKSALLSSFVSITYYKGFSLYKANSLDESAEWILQVAYKIDKEGGLPFYVSKTAENGNAEVSTTAENGNDEKYSSILKRTKKNNITRENIGEIMLGQIPNVSSAVAIAIMHEFKTIKGLMEALIKDKTSLSNIKTLNKDNKFRKISKTSIENIYSYLLSEPPVEISIQ